MVGIRRGVHRRVCSLQHLHAAPCTLCCRGCYSICRDVLVTHYSLHSLVCCLHVVLAHSVLNCFTEVSAYQGKFPSWRLPSVYDLVISKGITLCCSGWWGCNLSTLLGYFTLQLCAKEFLDWLVFAWQPYVIGNTHASTCILKMKWGTVLCKPVVSQSIIEFRRSAN